jgi:hypothetical protein
LKTITATHQNEMNYGAVLQAYALQKQLHKLHVDDEILDLKKTHQMFNKVKFNKHLLGNMYSNICNLLCILQRKKRIKRFREFVNNNIKMTHHYETIEEVTKSPPVADAYITGSDQTFNTHWGIRPDKFLRFGSKETKRISYAASMGIPIVKDEYLNDFVSAIKAYSFLSVREQCSADYISKVCNMPCSTNLDPTLLLSKEEWSELASSYRLGRKIRREKYILVYYLLENSLLNIAVREINKETGLKVIVLTPNAICRIKKDMIIRDAGPLEFLSLFNNAEYILTTTFHGVCFSIIFQKPFSTFISKKDEIRINSLLNILNLSDRIITSTSEITFNEILYNNVNEIIEMERKKANEYLVKALGI